MKKNRVLLKVVGVGILGVVLCVYTTFSAQMIHAGDGSTKEDSENEELPELFIKAINPGYTVDGKSNVGEMIEIARKESDAPILLAGTTVGYTNSSGNYSALFEFPEYSWMTGESILLRLASSPDSELANITYTKTIAFKASLVLKRGEEVLDEVCWTSKEGCYKEFKSVNPTTLVRNLETMEFEHLNEYEPKFSADNYYIEDIKDDEKTEEIKGQCKGLQFSEILSYYESSKSEQFIELYNASAEQILMDGCMISYKNKNYMLKGILKPEEYFVYYPTEFSLTKNPTNGNLIELVDINGEMLDTLNYPNGQRKATAYALIGYDEKGEEVWRITYAPTPGQPNNYQEFKSCEAGKVINEATGNCVKVATVTEKICAEGQYLNILTGRCRKIETSSEKTCKEGYYLNPETNRCRKVIENTGADYGLEPEEYAEESSFVALWAVAGVIGIGAAYVIYEFRYEIVKRLKRAFKRV